MTDMTRKSAAVQKAYELGVEEAPMLLMTTSMVAEKLGITTGRVRQLSKRLDVGHQLHDGKRSMWIFTPGHFAVLRDRQDGRALRYQK